jgi:zinc transporter ZupT
MNAGWSRTKTFAANVFSASLTFPGAYMVLFLMQDAHERIGLLLAISAGVFLYLGASDFLPEVAEEEDKKKSLKKYALLLLGVFLMYTLTLLTPEH